MTEIEKKANALVNDVRVERILYPISENFSRKSSEIEALCRLIEQHEALQADNALLREALKQIEAATYPRPLGKSWRMDLSSSKHDRCIHDEWMYDTCEGCLDDFIRKALQETGQ